MIYTVSNPLGEKHTHVNTSHTECRFLYIPPVLVQFSSKANPFKVREVRPKPKSKIFATRLSSNVVDLFELVGSFLLQNT